MKTLLLKSTPQPEVQSRLDRALLNLCGREAPWKWDADNTPARDALTAWIAAGDLRKMPRLNGPVGTGKSRLIQAAGIVLRDLHGCGIRLIDAIELPARHARASKSSTSVIEELADPDKYPLLVIEDIGLEKNAPSFLTGDTGINVVSELVQLRYKRWQAGHPLATGFTDNLLDEALLEKYGDRCVSRMVHMTFLVPVEGKDRRASAPPPQAAPEVGFQLPVPTPEEVEQGARLQELYRNNPRRSGRVVSLRDSLGTDHLKPVEDSPADVSAEPQDYRQELDPERHLEQYRGLLRLMGSEELLAEGKRIAVAQPKGHEHFSQAIEAEIERRKEQAA